MIKEINKKISINAHSSIKIGGSTVIYIDPFMVEDGERDADVIFITHDHHDHLSKEDIEKVCKDDTVYVVPESCADSAKKAGISEGYLKTMRDGDVLEIMGISALAVPAYNLRKQFHPKRNGWLGYVLTIDDVRVYIVGDTDVTPEAKKVSCDIAMVPVGGTYTTDPKEAAELVNAIKPKIAIPTHYGSIVGDANDDSRFMEKVDPDIWVAVKL
jgi:L-ascorbate metabolism protein UlaG (beta-lactamase superfamily)